MRFYKGWLLLVVILTTYILSPSITMSISAEETYGVPNVYLDNYTIVKIDSVFGDYQKTVDENIYYSLTEVGSDTLVRIFGEANTPMFNKARETINPLMALATTWGEAGSSYPGISMTTVMDFNPDTYINEIDWINVTQNLSQVDSSWYYTNAKSSYNTNTSGKAYHMPNALLQFPRSGSRETSEMVGLGVGPYQVTSSDWESWDLDNRVNPVWGYESSLKKVGKNWINCGIDPISDLTVYAALSLGHQGGGLISYDFGRQLISIINRPEVQESMNRVGYKMYTDLVEKQTTKKCSLSSVNVGKYYEMLVNDCGINFAQYTGGPGSTNKGTYTVNHCLRYIFYKYYYMGGYL